MARPDWSVLHKFEVKLSGDGGAWTDLSAWVMGAIRWTRGIQGGGMTDLVATIGQLQLKLWNAATPRTNTTLGYFSPRHANLVSGWALGIQCRLQLQHPVTLAWSTAFLGRLASVRPSPGRYAERTVEVSVLDWMDEASRWSITPDVGPQVDVRGNDVITAILATMPVQPASTSLQTGSEVYPYALDQKRSTETSVLSVFADLAASERGPIFVEMDGTLVYERRHTRMLSGASVWTINDGVIHLGGGSVSVPTAEGTHVTNVRVVIHPKTVDTDTSTVLFSQKQAIFLPAGATKTINAQFRDATSGDYIGGLVSTVTSQMTADELGGGTDLTADLTVTSTEGPSGVTLVLENTGASDGWIPIDGIQVLGRGIYDRGEVAIDAAAGTGSPIVIDMPYQVRDTIGQAAADFLLDTYGRDVTQVSAVTVRGTTATKVTQLLARDISDRVHVTEYMTAVDDDFFINGEAATLTPDGILEKTYTLGVASGVGSYWVLGTSTLGVDTIPAPF